jgi:hypothetical protein
VIVNGEPECPTGLGPHRGPEPPPGPYTQECEIELWGRPAKFAGDPGSHTYIDFINLTVNISTIFEGGGDHAPGPKHWTLDGSIEPPDAPLGKGTGHVTDPTASNNHELGFPVAVPCNRVGLLKKLVNAYDDGPRVPYAFLPNGTTTWNSNSFTYTLLTDIGLSTGSFGIGDLPTGLSLLHPFYPGWGFMVPGL